MLSGSIGVVPPDLRHFVAESTGQVPHLSQASLIIAVITRDLRHCMSPTYRIREDLLGQSLILRQPWLPSVGITTAILQSYISEHGKTLEIALGGLVRESVGRKDRARRDAMLWHRHADGRTLFGDEPLFEFQRLLDGELSLLRAVLLDEFAGTELYLAAVRDHDGALLALRCGAAARPPVRCCCSPSGALLLLALRCAAAARPPVRCIGKLPQPFDLNWCAFGRWRV